ncbi:hypothetical protein [Methylophilus rhizosphaerae]|uniref:hypothetical protein n=1 Tax=Methylophilus rhizosphaerae TaxID=492660 RepID=UPI000B822F4B|nr:hypothetical protein [Methylophilus rhizosphaerae]
MKEKPSLIVKLWFLLNTVITLAPPIYWYANKLQHPIFGLPPTIFYFLIVGLSITTSIVYAYLDEKENGRIE